MRNSEVDARSSDDEIYRWFVGSLAYLGTAAEVESGVIRVRLTGEDGDGGPGSSGRVIDVVVSRQELRSVAWAEDDIFDDRNEPVVPESRDPVRSGLAQLSLFTEEALVTARPSERYVVFHRGRLVPSVRRELPPVRGTYDEPESAPPGPSVDATGRASRPGATLPVMTSPFTVPSRECPCGSGAAYDVCCGPLHDGAPPETAEALMRSRYSAYAVGHLDYVFRTWHPRTRPADLTSTPGTIWVGLEVLRTAEGGPSDDVGEVEFRARFRTPDGEHVLHETSRFERRRGRWVYVDGDVVR